jgi:hypothetical protein
MNKASRGYDPLKDGPELDQPSPATIEQVLPPHTDKPADDLLGFRNPIYRIVAGIVTIVLLIVVGLALKGFLGKRNADPASGAAMIQPGITPTVTLNVQPPVLADVREVAFSGGIPRLALMHTNIPARPREEIEKYTVQEGDTIFGIAEKYGLEPETVLWANYYTLLDNPAFLKPGEILNILPVNGVYHKWSAGEGLNGVSSYYGVTPEDIINYPPNHLKAEEIGDYAHPNITPNSWLIVPNGTREFIDWTPRISREDPSVAKVLGAGACGAVTDGPIGTGGFIYPTNDHALSGFDYSPQTNHFGIDLNGETGDPIYATDSGVVVYSGWNDWGYGFMVVIDHGNGWQSLYAHMSELYAGCGEWVNQGQTIGLMGSTGKSTGSHLHFEMMSDSGGKVNPKDFLY